VRAIHEALRVAPEHPEALELRRQALAAAERHPLGGRIDARAGGPSSNAGWSDPAGTGT